MEHNPFLVKGYISPDFFCDREKETAILLSNIENGIDTTLISPRKYGKTGLIQHVFFQIKEQDIPFETIYVDIFATQSLHDFVRVLTEAIITKFPEKSTIGNKFFSFIKGYKPIVTYDLISGTPQIEFGFHTENEKEYTLKGILSFLNSQNKKVVLAIDEFQQITEYPETNVEALLRTYIQQLHNIRFIFCGSKKTLMTQIFNDANRPFYSSTQQISLNKISNKAYSEFIREKFKPATISDEAIQFILDWTKTHTYYTQSLCNEIFAKQLNNIALEHAHNAANDILEKEASNFLQIRELVPIQQWKLLIAVAKEESVTSVTSANFLTKYQIGSATNARRSLEALTQKELLLESLTLESKSYSIYNVFFSRWLARNY